MATAQLARVTKLESHDIAVKLPAHKFHELFTTKLNQTPNACPRKIHGVEVLEGQWGKEGCVLYWRYAAPDGSNKVHTSKEIMDVIDYKEKFASYKVVEGDLLSTYRSFKFLLNVTPKADGGSLVRWSVEYEKTNEDAPDADSMISLLVDYTKEVDAYFSTKP